MSAAWPKPVLLCWGVLSCARAPAGAPEPASRVQEWTAYAHDVDGTKYSPAARVTRENVARLTSVWTYRTGDFALGHKAARDETTPLFVEGLLFASTPFGGVRALEAETGREVWAFEPELDLDGDYGDFTNRGVSTWLDASAPPGAACRRRIYVATVDARLISLDARTGVPCPDFGEHGQVHLERGLVNPPQYAGEYAVTSPPLVVGESVLVGSAVADNHRANAPSGVVRAFDARTGTLRWAWDPIPRAAAEPSYGTWRGPAAHQTGAANAWAPFSADPARDLVFVPIGSPSPDFYGGERLGQNLSANAVVALRASTGVPVWHFQAVHHDIWDYDVASQPALFTLHRAGLEIPALVQATKMGHLFFFNRETGEPLFPIEERKVPASDVPGEEAWPTQPFPLRPAPLVPAHLTPDEAFGVTEAGRAACKEQLARARSEGIFTPPSVRGSVLFPGNLGGANWSGVAIDPVRHLGFIPTNRVATLVKLVPRAEYRDLSRRNDRLDEIAPQAGTAFAMEREALLSPEKAPCNPPPWGALTAVDLDSGEVRWEVPLGAMKHLARFPGNEKWGSVNLGGMLATAGGLVFGGGALDQRFRAYDSDTGRELWSVEMPAGVHAAPMTYVTASGRQFVVVAAGGHKDLRDKLGDYLVAFALPDSPAPPAPPAAAAPAPGRYEGYLILDSTRRHATFELGPDELSLTTVELGLLGHGPVKVDGGAVTAEVAWRYPAGKCGGTMQLRGAAANEGTAFIGELDYVDGCERNEKKVGTFAGWRGPRKLSRLPRSP